VAQQEVLAPARLLRYEVDEWGVGELWVADGCVVWHELPRLLGPPRASTRFERSEKIVAGVKHERVGVMTIAGLLETLIAYFRGKRVGFDGLAIDLDWCTPFQRAVARALRAVPHGETVTYGELAALAGHPNAQRAAGTFCANNRYPLILPCHRVVAAAGLGSYGSLGVEMKRRLLELEDAL
jgi:methylated-DNA-[protein]-cysteine S-methyltransferase